MIHGGIGYVVCANLCQSFEKHFQGNVAAVQVSLISDTDFIGKYLFQFGTLFGKPHLDSERIATEIAVAKSVVLEINFVVSIPCFVGEVAVMLFVGIVAHYFRHFAHSVGTTPEHVSMNFVIAREFIGRNPITKVHPVAISVVNCILSALMHCSVGFYPRQHIVYLAFRSVIVFGNHLLVAIIHVIFPRHDAHGGTPSHSAAGTGAPWSGIGHISRFFILRIAHGIEPAAEESGSVEIVHHPGANCLSVASVRYSLAVGTITLHAAMNIVLFGALPYFVYAVEQFV